MPTESLPKIPQKPVLMPLPTLSEIHALRSHAQVVQGQIQLQHTAEEIWPYVSNTDLLDKKIGLSAVNYKFAQQTQDKSIQGNNLIYGETTLGFKKAAYLELPYEWIPPTTMSAERIFDYGWLQYLAARWQIENLTDGSGCVITLQLKYVPRYRWLPLALGLRRTIHQLLAVLKELDNQLSPQQVLGIETFFDSPASQETQIAKLTAQWSDLMPQSTIPQQVAEFIYTAPDKYAHKLRPFEVADYFNLPRLEVLTFCLLATKAGFLDLSWDILCPACQGANVRAVHLWNLHSSEVHCEACNVQYGSRFDENVEVTFNPRADLRQLDNKTYCFANPAVKNHIWAHLRLDPTETRTLKLSLPVGEYHLRSLSLPGLIKLQITADSSWSTESATVSLTLNEQFAQTSTLTLISPFQLTLHNPSDRWLTLRIEQLHYNSRIATAAWVTSLQDFRDLFSSSEVLQPNMHLGISNQVFLFSDLVGSTQLYEHKGDANAFSLVQEHFNLMIPIIRQHQGGVVKTIGDAIMAVFTQSEAAVRASLEILATFARRNANCLVEDQLILKLGLHKGPCIVLNLNDKLDYFGNTVNLAARIQGISYGNDLVMSAGLFKEVQPLLADYSSLQITSLEAELKGISKKTTLYRLEI